MSNPTATITDPNTAVRVVVDGQDSTNTHRHVTITATTSDYAHAYVAKGATPGEFIVRANSAVFPTTPGSSIGVDITFTATDAAGNTISPLSISLVLQGPPIPPNADHLVITDGPTTGLFPFVPPDPGSSSVTVTF